MKLTFLALPFLLLACGQEPKKQPAYVPHTKTTEFNGFDEYIDMFLDDAAEYSEEEVIIDDLVVQFDTIPQISTAGRTVGVCFRGPNTTPTIKIDRDFWNGSTNVRKMILMYHELGHCVLKRGHVNTRSLMLPSLILPAEFVYFKDFYLDELFNSNPNPIPLTHTGCNHPHHEEHHD